jgi:hypothetical protein
MITIEKLGYKERWTAFASLASNEKINEGCGLCVFLFVWYRTGWYRMGRLDCGPQWLGYYTASDWAHGKILREKGARVREMRMSDNGEG